MDAGNPLVASFQDNLDSSDEEALRPPKRRPDSLVGIALSSGDEGAATVLTNGLEKEEGADDDDDDVVQLNGKVVGVVCDLKVIVIRNCLVLVQSDIEFRR